VPRRTNARTRSATRRTAIRLTAVVVVGATAIVAADAPSPASAAVSGSHVIAPLYRTSGLELSGYTANRPLSVTASRNGVPLSTATAVTDGAGSAAVNGGAGACWTGTTLELLPGDTITVTGDGLPAAGTRAPQAGAQAAGVAGATAPPAGTPGTSIAPHGRP
jgi:hypothetical protein